MIASKATLLGIFKLAGLLICLGAAQPTLANKCLTGERVVRDVRDQYDKLARETGCRHPLPGPLRFLSCSLMRVAGARRMQPTSRCSSKATPTGAAGAERHRQPRHRDQLGDELSVSLTQNRDGHSAELHQIGIDKSLSVLQSGGPATVVIQQR